MQKHTNYEQNDFVMCSNRFHNLIAGVFISLLKQCRKFKFRTYVSSH